MTFDPTGRNLIAGKWRSGAKRFSSSPANGPVREYAVAAPNDVDEAVEAAEEAFWSFAYTTEVERANFLTAIADEIEARADAVTAISAQETGLPEARVQGERQRTTGQLRLFANHILKGDYLDKRHDKALPDRQPLPRPDLRLVQRPIGPVAVFGASNFPLAFSTAGGDTASALAAGCPVVVKGHPAHPGTCEVVASAIDAAIKRSGMHRGAFSLIQGDDHAVGTQLVQHPLITAVGFTGSLAGGRALFDLCAARSTPIPFFGELGSINPMFLLPEASRARGADIGAAWAGSLTLGAGQFCTNPGVAVVLKGLSDSFVTAAMGALRKTGAQTMLTDGIAAAYRGGQQKIAGTQGVLSILTTSSAGRTATPFLFQTDAQTWLANDTLQEEVFGPLGLVVTVEDLVEMRTIAQSLKGQLTATLHMDAGDRDHARSLIPILERKAGRILANGFPTGVEVAESMVHGGPYPASTNFGATSVGTLAIRRFLRPVCYQNLSENGLLHQ